MELDRGKLPVCFLIFLILVCSTFPANGDDDLLLKLKIQPMMDKKKAPEFSMAGLRGRKVELKDFRGKIILLTFWATWCGPCKEEMPSIEALHRQFRGKDFVVLTVAVDLEGSTPVEKFVAKYGYSFDVLIDSKSEVLDRYRVERIPTTFLIDRKGRIIGKALGPRDWKSPEAISLFNRLMDRIEK